MSDRNDASVDRLRRWVRGEDDSLAHAECIEALPEYVDAEIAGARVAEKFPRIKQHLASCADCAEQYAMLLQITLEAMEIPAPAKIPAPNLDFLNVPTLAEFVTQQAAAILKTLAPAQLRDLPIIAQVFFERVAVLGDQFMLQPRAAQALGFGPGELNDTVLTLAIVYTATRALAQTFTLAEIDALAANQELPAHFQAQARAAASAIRAPAPIAQAIAVRFAELASADLAGWREMIAQQK